MLNNNRIKIASNKIPTSQNLLYFFMVSVSFLLIILPRNLSNLLFVFIGFLGLLSFFSRYSDKFGYLTLTSYLLLISALGYQQATNENLWAVESKIVVLPFVLLFINSLKTRLTLRRLTVVIQLLVLFNYATLFYSKLSFRYIDTLGFESTLSIYMGVLLAVAYSSCNSMKLRILILPLIFFSGSGTATFSLMIVVFIENISIIKKSKIKALFLFLLLLLVWIGFLELMTLRGRDINDIYTIDRIQLIYAGFNFIFYEFSFVNLLFGYGVGYDIPSIYNYFYSEATVVHWLQTSRAIDGFTGLVFHNEYLRVIFNYGGVGLIWINYFLYYNLRDNKVLLCIISVASLFSPTIYATSLIFFTLLLARLKKLSTLE